MQQRTVAGALWINAQRDGSTYVLQLMGELDESGVESVEAELHQAEQTEVERIVVDLSCLRFIDSSGIAMLVRAHQQNKDHSGRLQMKRSDDPAVQQIFQIADLEHWLPFMD